VIEEAATDRIPTIDLLRALVDLEEGPWARWWLASVASPDQERRDDTAACPDCGARSAEPGH
jgi:hypothetical protein